MREKLYVGVQTLAVGPGDVRSRLLGAFMSFHTLRVEDFPLELQRDWKWVMMKVTRFGPIYDHKGNVRKGSVEHTMERIHNSTGAKIARRIFDLNWKMHNEEKYQ